MCGKKKRVQFQARKNGFQAVVVALAAASTAILLDGVVKIIQLLLHTLTEEIF